MPTFDLKLPHTPHRTLRIDAADHYYVPRLLKRDGLAGYERETMAVFLAAVERLGGDVFDVGANMGVFSLVARSVLPHPVTAFEPTPQLAGLLRHHLDINALDNVEVEEAALGAEPGTATLYLSNVTDSSNSLLEGFRPSDDAIEVRIDTIDGYVAATGRVPLVLKIDTEATEPDVLRGASALMAERRPWIICEVLAARTEEQLEALLTPHGYHWFQITGERPLVPRREIFGDRAFTYNNWLFAPEPPDDRFWDRVLHWSRGLSRCPPPPEPPPPPTPPPPSPPPPRRKRGVYGRKKMLAGILGGMAVGGVIGRGTSRSRRTA